MDGRMTEMVSWGNTRSEEREVEEEGRGERREED